ncbi:MAG: gas vesicle protein K [Methanotrichaceae archaeon]
MVLEIDEDNLKHGVLGLVMAIVEVVRDALQIQALKRMESGMLSEEEMNRLGEALMELDIAIEEIKKEQGITESVKAVRNGLDEVVDDVLDRMINPERWRDEVEGKK